MFSQQPDNDHQYRRFAEGGAKFSAGSHADRAREPGQAGNRAAISVSLVVPWVNPAAFLIYYFLFMIAVEPLGP
jgi:hypothetical protein